MISLIVNGWPPSGELGAAAANGTWEEYGERHLVWQPTQMCTASHLVLQYDVVPSNSKEDYRRWHNYIEPVG